VGFIQKLPTQLVAAFRATLEELGESSLLLHVVDVSSPNAAAQTDTVLGVLKELGIELPIVTVWNKVTRPCKCINLLRRRANLACRPALAMLQRLRINTAGGSMFRPRTCAAGGSGAQGHCLHFSTHR
jgi:hypothetical protein